MFLTGIYLILTIETVVVFFDYVMCGYGREMYAQWRVIEECVALFYAHLF
jgi:hypothetical protein